MTNGEIGPALIETIYASTVLSRSIDSIIGDLEGQVLELLRANALNPARSLTAADSALVEVPPEVERHAARQPKPHQTGHWLALPARSRQAWRMPSRDGR